VAITIAPYDYFKAHLGGGVASGDAPIDYLTDTIKISLHTSTYSPALTTHDFFNDATNEVAAGSGYTAGGETLASKTVSTPAAGVVTYDAADVVFSFSGSKTWRYGVVYKSTGTGTTSPLMWLLTWDSDQTVSTPYTLTLNAAGLFTIS
jgi:hypothetical protein